MTTSTRDSPQESHLLLLDPTPPPSYSRWIASLLVASTVMAVFLMVAVTTEPETEPLSQPFMELEHLLLRPRPKAQPKPAAEPPKKTEKNVEHKERPVAEAPVAPSEVATGPADAVSTPKPARRKPEPMQVQSALELDNTDFQPIYNPRPDYPAVALKAGIQGYVDVDLVVSETGRVERFSIVNISGHPSFGLETAKVLSKWRFPPPRMHGRKTRVKYRYRVNFRLD